MSTVSQQQPQQPPPSRYYAPQDASGSYHPPYSQIVVAPPPLMQAGPAGPAGMRLQGMVASQGVQGGPLMALPHQGAPFGQTPQMAVRGQNDTQGQVQVQVLPQLTDPTQPIGQVAQPLDPRFPQSSNNGQKLQGSTQVDAGLLVGQQPTIKQDIGQRHPSTDSVHRTTPPGPPGGVIQNGQINNQSIRGGRLSNGGTSQLPTPPRVQSPEMQSDYMLQQQRASESAMAAYGMHPPLYPIATEPAAVAAAVASQQQQQNGHSAQSLGMMGAMGMNAAMLPRSYSMPAQMIPNGANPHIPGPPGAGTFSTTLYGFNPHISHPMAAMGMNPYSKPEGTPNNDPAMAAAMMQAQQQVYAQQAAVAQVTAVAMGLPHDVASRHPVRPHGQVRKHECAVCGKAFARPSALRTHVYTHTGEKPFTCTQSGCNRSFSVLSNLRRHQRVHIQDH